MSPSVGVVIPTHNRSELLEITLRNVFCSEGVELQVIVVDDASSDDTPTVLEGWSARESRLSFIRFEQSIGACRARNLGFSKLDSPFVCFLDSDDLVHPDKLRRQAEQLTGDNELDGTVCQMAHFEHDPNEATILWNTFQGGDARHRFLAHDPVWGMHAPLWRSDSIRRWGGFDESLPMAQDYEFHARILALGARVCLVPELLSYCRQHVGPSIGKSRQIARGQTLLKIFRELRELATEDGDAELLRGDFLWLASLAAFQQEPALFEACVAEAKPVPLRFRLWSRLALASGRYRFFKMARAVADAELEIPLGARESWHQKHLVADEADLVVLPMPAESY